MSYRVLALDPYSQHMSLPVLRKIRDLVKAGAVGGGSQARRQPQPGRRSGRIPAPSPISFGVRTASTRQGQGLRRPDAGRRADGAARCRRISSTPSRRADTELVRSPQAGRRRTLLGGQPQRSRPRRVDATFRVQGKAPELWHADTGKIEPAVLPDRERPHHRAPASGSLRSSVRRLPQAGRGAVAYRAADASRRRSRRSRALGSRLPAGPRRAREDHARQAGVLERQLRRRREVLLRHRYLHEDHRRLPPTGSSPARSCGWIWAT